MDTHDTDELDHLDRTIDAHKPNESRDHQPEHALHLTDFSSLTEFEKVMADDARYHPPQLTANEPGATNNKGTPKPGGHQT